MSVYAPVATQHDRQFVFTGQTFHPSAGRGNFQNRVDSRFPTRQNFGVFRPPSKPLMPVTKGSQQSCFWVESAVVEETLSHATRPRDLRSSEKEQNFLQCEEEA